MIIGSGFSTDVGGAQGTGYQGRAFDARYGVPIANWMSWSTYKQDMFIRDFNRPSEQANYYQEDKPFYFEEAQQYQDFKEGDATNPFQPLLDTTSDVFLGVGLLGLALLFRK
jgi:hypothetical protein